MTENVYGIASGLHIDFGKGYRIYYYRELNNIVILIVAGSDKGSQDRTLAQVNKYLKKLEERIHKNV